MRATILSLCFKNTRISPKVFSESSLDEGTFDKIQEFAELDEDEREQDGYVFRSY